MTIVVALVAYTPITLFSGPLLLSRGHWRLRLPRLALVSWYVLFLTGLTASVAAAAISVHLGISTRTQLPTDDTWVGPTRDFFVAWVALAIAGGLLSLVLTKAGAMIIAEREMRADFAHLVETSTYRHELVQGLRVNYIASSAPIACTLRGRAGGGLTGGGRASGGRSSELIVSSRLDDDLCPFELRAVIEHERAHLQGHHDLLTRLAALNCACLPQLLAPRELRRSTALLIELIADDTAARRTSTASLVSALTKLAAVQHSAMLQLRAQRLLAR